MKILITGGAGFIGSHIVDIYIKNGHDVVVVDDLSSGNKSNLNPKVKFYHTNILDTKKLEKVFTKEKPDIVSHQAAQISAPKSVIDPIFDAQNNIIGGLNVLELSAKYKIKCFIFASSAAVYGEPCYLPVDEIHPCKPQTPYGISKYAFELYLMHQAKLSGFNYIIFRYANVYGPRQSYSGEGGVIATFSNLFLNNKQPRIFGSGKKTRDYIYVKDIAKANLLALTVKKTNQVFNLGRGKETTDKELFDFFCKLITKINPIYAHDRPGDIQRFLYNSAKVNSKLGWLPETELKDGIEKTIKFYKNNI